MHTLLPFQLYLEFLRAVRILVYVNDLPKQVLYPDVFLFADNSKHLKHISLTTAST